jgi:DNA-binding transcriptional LysR family regulator
MTRGAHVPAGLEAIRLAVEPVTMISSEKTALKGSVPLDALRGSEWVLSREGCAYRALLRRVLEEAEIPFMVSAEVHELDLLLHLVSQGVGASILASRLLPLKLEAVGLQVFQINGIPLSVESCLIRRRTDRLVPGVMALIEQTATAMLVNSRKLPWSYAPFAQAYQA